MEFDKQLSARDDSCALQHEPAASAIHIGGVAVPANRPSAARPHRPAPELPPFQAAHDELTGLPNHKLLLDRLQQALRQAGRRGDLAALLCLGIHDSKAPDGGRGHVARDHLLAEVAARLPACVRSHDTVARHSQHDFAIVLGEIRSPSDVGTICDTIFARLAEPYMVGGTRIELGFSIGVALAPQDGDQAPLLLRHAGQALALARRHGGGNYHFYAPETNLRTSERIELEQALRQALAQGELRLSYQPLVDLHSGQVASLEALLRWQHPGRGLLPAQDFLPVAEEAGLIGAIGDWVLQRACADLRGWQAAVPVAINLSARQLRDPDLADKVGAALAEHGLAPAALVFEITEAALQQDLRANEHCLSQLSELGVGLTMDDFGTGQSSLNTLKRYPFAQVKIDASFIRALPDGGEAAVMAKTIIGVARNLGIRAVAEGVETAAQCDFLRAEGCELVQGQLFAGALDAADIGALLHDKTALPRPARQAATPEPAPAPASLYSGAPAFVS